MTHVEQALTAATKAEEHFTMSGECRRRGLHVHALAHETEGFRKMRAVRDALNLEQLREESLRNAIQVFADRLNNA